APNLSFGTVTPLRSLCYHSCIAFYPVLQPESVLRRRPVIGRLGLTSVFVAAIFLIFVPCAVAQANVPRITQDIDGSSRFALTGNLRPEARPENDRGRVVDSVPLQHMLLLLKRSPEQ